MAFHDIRLPDHVERGAVGGPGFKTTVIMLASGHEARNGRWSQTRAKYNIGYGIQNSEDLIEVRDFFFARRGKLHTFRFKDWVDFVLPANTAFAYGDGVKTEFQLHKPYTSGGETHFREITKPVAGIEVTANGTDGNNDPYSATATVDLTTGLCTFAEPVPDGVGIFADGEFDLHVRFDTDTLEIQAEAFVGGPEASGIIPQIPVIEVRNET
jgi:uncharacterized protein (TIGR02217 family)